MDVDKRLAGHQWPGQRRVVRPDALPKRAGHRFRHPTARDCAEELPVLRKQAFVVGAAKAVCLLQDRVEDRDEIAGRGIDDLQHLGGRGLLLQGLARLGQEPRVLHGDNGLRSEVLQQHDLFGVNGRTSRR